MHETARRMHHRHAVLHGDRLPPSRLDVDIASGEARKNQRLFAMDEVTAVELGEDSDGKAQPPHCCLGDRLIRHRSNKVSTQADEHPRVPIDHRLHRVDDRMSVCARRLETKYLLDLVEQLRFGLLVDADRAVALHVRVPAHRTYSGARLAEISAKQKKIEELLNILQTVPMLRNPHPVANDHGLRVHIARRHSLNLIAREAGHAQDVVPVGTPQIFGECYETMRMLLDKCEIEDGLPTFLDSYFVRLEHELHDALQRRHIAANADLAIFARNLRRT